MPPILINFSIRPSYLENLRIFVKVFLSPGTTKNFQKETGGSQQKVDICGERERGG